MIYELQVDVAADLAGKNFPVPFSYGPERADREGYATHVVIERDRQSGDTVDPNIGTNTNPKKHRVRTLGCLATIYANSTLDGARIEDHERYCDQIVDALIIAILDWATETKAGDIQFPASGYVPKSERNDVETWPGVVYELKFLVHRAVLDNDFAGEARLEGSASSVANTKTVSLAS